MSVQIDMCDHDQMNNTRQTKPNKERKKKQTKFMSVKYKLNLN